MSKLYQRPSVPAGKDYLQDPEGTAHTINYTVHGIYNILRKEVLQDLFARAASFRDTFGKFQKF
jgi:hypothetical protein